MAVVRAYGTMPGDVVAPGVIERLIAALDEVLGVSVPGDGQAAR